MLVDEEIDVQSRRDIILREARKDLILYNTICVPDYIAGKMHRFIAAKLEAVARGEITRLIINTPPQYGKSRLCSIAGPTWMLGINPRLNVCAASYSQDLSNRNSRESRERLKQTEYQDIFPETRLADDNQGVERWAVTKGGSYKAVGIGGSLSGHSADVIVIDDFLKDYEQAQSDVIREKVWEWFWSVAYTRLSPGGAIVIIGTRWHTDDLCGRLLDPKRIAALDNEQAKSETWEHINLPSIAQENDPLGREIGEPLFPERYTKKKVLAQKSVTLPYIWSAMHDGNPVQKGGNYIKVDKFKIHKVAKPDLRWVWPWDLATSDDQKNDYTAGCAMAVDENKELWIRRMTRGQWIWPVSRTMIANIAVEEKYFILGIEAVAGFKTAYQNLLEVLPAHIRCIELGVDKDKLTRAQPWITMVYNEKVNLVQGDWVPDFLLECTSFPNGKHDDQVDAVSLGWRMLTDASISPMQVNVHDKYRQAMNERRQRTVE